MDGDRRAFDAGTRREPRQRLERGEVLRAAVGVPAVVERVDANEDVVRAEHLGPRECVGEEDRVASGNVRHGDVRPHGVLAPTLRNRDRRIGESGSAEGTEIDVRDAVLVDIRRIGDALGGVELRGVALPVREREGMDDETVALRDGDDGGGVEPAGEQDHCGRTHGARQPTSQYPGAGTDRKNGVP